MCLDSARSGLVDLLDIYSACGIVRHGLPLLNAGSGPVDGRLASSLRLESDALRPHGSTVPLSMRRACAKDADQLKPLARTDRGPEARKEVRPLHVSVKD